MNCISLKKRNKINLTVFQSVPGLPFSSVSSSLSSKTAHGKSSDLFSKSQSSKWAPNPTPSCPLGNLSPPVFFPLFSISIFPLHRTPPTSSLICSIAFSLPTNKNLPTSPFTYHSQPNFPFMLPSLSHLSFPLFICFPQLLAQIISGTNCYF